MDITRTYFKMEDQYITMTKGDTLSFNVELYDVDGELYDIDLTSAYFTCKKTMSEEDSIPVFQKTLGDGISKLDTGLYVVRVAPDDTKELEAGQYYYDLRLVVDQDVYTPMKGILEIDRTATKEV